MIITTILPEKSDGSGMCRQRLRQCNYFRYKRCEGREKMELSKWWLLVSVSLTTCCCLAQINYLIGSLNFLSCAHFQRIIMIIEPKNNIIVPNITTTTHNNNNTYRTIGQWLGLSAPIKHTYKKRQCWK